MSSTFKEQSEEKGIKDKLPMAFITNEGQINPKVKYYVMGKNFQFYFTKKEVVLSLIKGTLPKNINENIEGKEESMGIALKIQFIDANKDVEIEGQIEGIGKVNYFKGNDPEKWCTSLSYYKKIVYNSLWKGIDLIFYREKDQLKYEFVVHPGADYKDIRLRYKGSDGISLDEKGNLIIKTELEDLIDEKPISYQQIKDKKVTIDSRFTVKHHKFKESTYSFEIGEGYNPDYSIIIDPTLDYSTYLGGTGSDNPRGIAVDNMGNAYVCGFTNSPNFPTTAGVFQPMLAGSNDVFVTKLNADGTGLIFSTYIGGTGSDAGTALAIDAAGNVYVTGGTISTDFPVVNPIQPALAGSTDAFILKLNATGTALIYSTYLGGSLSDQGFGLGIDSAGNTIVSGRTFSVDFPTVNAIQPVMGGGVDAFVAKINPAGTALVYSTFLGGSGVDFSEAIAVDSIGNAYVTGTTTSGDFPVVNAIQPIPGGGQDAFITKINPAGTALVYSTYLGGSGNDEGNAITLDSNNNVYLTGETNSPNFPIMNAIQPTIGGNIDAYATKINAAGTALVYSTYLGGSENDTGEGIAVDRNGNAYLTGLTESANFPTVNPIFPALSGTNDAYVTMINATGTALIYSTYLGGSSGDVGFAIAVDDTGCAYTTGQTNSSNFPVTPGAFETVLPGSPSGYVTKICEMIPPPGPPSKIEITNQNITAIAYETSCSD